MSKQSQERYKAAGLCILCGKNPPRQDKQSCQKCSERQIRTQQARRLKTIELGQCCDCGSSHIVTKRHCEACRQRHNTHTIRRYNEIKETVFLHYGGYKCECCGETEKDFLTLDHIYGGGGKHRKEIGGNSRTYRWIVDNGFPPLFRVYCMNCNWGSRLNNGVCPHKRMLLLEKQHPMNKPLSDRLPITRTQQ
jgi:hypothetical protein